jgi:hypothetical protein
MLAQPGWMLVPWLVFGLAATLKLRRLARMMRRHLLSGRAGTERFRRSLERIWDLDLPAGPQPGQTGRNRHGRPPAAADPLPPSGHSPQQHLHQGQPGQGHDPEQGRNSGQAHGQHRG